MTETPSDVIAAQVRERRRRLGMSREDLAAACAEHGAPELTFGALTNIETGRPNPETGIRRREVSVDELIVIARALDVAPIALIYPDDKAGAEWFVDSEIPTGEEALMAQMRDLTVEVRRALEALQIEAENHERIAL